MKINDWSVLPTPDSLGLALKPMSDHELKPLYESEYEIAVALRNGRIEVSIYRDGQDDPLATMTHTIQPTAI